MNRITALAAITGIGLSFWLTGCTSSAKSDPRVEEPPKAEVEHAPSAEWVKVDRPEQFPLAIATAHATTPELSVTGVVSPDVARSVPVLSLAGGRAVDVRVRLGDQVTKGQLLMRIQSPDVSDAFSDYGKAVADERLASAALDRAQALYAKGAIAQKDLEVAVDTEKDAKVTLDASIEQLKVLGADPAHHSPIVDVLAPVSGVITEQNVTASGGVRSMDNSPNLFTISDLSHVWVICDVYENDLAMVHLNEPADIRLNAYPGKVFQGRISDIGAILDPNVRTAKARIDVENPGLMRVGMFATATFHDQQKQISVVVPASAVLHLHDKDWVFVPHHSAATFHRVEVQAGGMISGQQVILSGIRTGERVVRDALMLQNTWSGNEVP
jgi:membrane fusion protein, heavy metal efflux system